MKRDALKTALAALGRSAKIAIANALKPLTDGNRATDRASVSG
jgi:hypothetical protein